MISPNDFKTGLTIEFEGAVLQIVDFQHVKPGKGAAFVRAKLKNVETGAVIEKTFNPKEKIEKAHIDRRTMQYLYSSGDDYIFMDTENYEQITLTKQQLDENVKFLIEDMEIVVLYYKDKPIGIELPNSVVLEVVETEPGIKGDTASGGSKPATLQTGLVIQVPFFINVGDKLKVDTRTKTYIERA
ncbi:translation elongation factor P (EF-P) [Anaerobranca californiensis DSM 14826]|jgi:elongation factor P|uniref:Elongation factor P n=1 Tax=Anaerobranca californiensis DSM 14826 TaxID=1120989 RepID=A0A1M6L855_9FIRM|nr:elongation factor P [Anaerobranca californiensis]SHJ67356.1 translation elongation factor P (EF-P) [Anaerobranca californiensis DSM 14826]